MRNSAEASPGAPAEHCSGSLTTVRSHTVTTNITNQMDAVLVLISLSFHYANAAPYEQHRRFVKRQDDSSSNPTQTSSSSTTLSTPEHSLPTSIRTRIPIYPSSTPSGEVQTAIPVHPDPGPGKGPIIGFSIGIVVLVLLLSATGWLLFLRYKRKKQQQTTSNNVVQLHPTNHSSSSTTKKSLDDTQSTASHLGTSDSR